MELVNCAGFTRFLYVPEDGTRFSSAVAARIEEALREAGLATGPEGEGVQWRPFRPDGELATYASRLGLVLPTLEVDWFDEEHAVGDPFLAPRGPWSRCPGCGKLVPEDGMVVLDEELVELTACRSCGSPFEPEVWEKAADRRLFSSRLVIALTADSALVTLPTFREGCPEFVRCVEEVVGAPVQELLLRG